MLWVSQLQKKKRFQSYVEDLQQLKYIYSVYSDAITELTMKTYSVHKLLLS